MVDLKTFSMMALEFDEVTEQPHFHKVSFRVRKKIFATLDTDTNKAVLKLSEHEQSIFMEVSNGSIYPVKGAWGAKGWTEVELNSIDIETLKFAMTTSYCCVAPKSLSEKYNN